MVFITGPRPVGKTYPEKQAILVTGSARLETFRQTGESLAGRYFHHHLMPISAREASSHLSPYEAVEQLNSLGGFPEPFLSGSERDADRWRNQYFTDIVREDILEFSSILESLQKPWPWMEPVLVAVAVAVGSNIVNKAIESSPDSDAIAFLPSEEFFDRTWLQYRPIPR